MYQSNISTLQQQIIYQSNFSTLQQQTLLIIAPPQPLCEIALLWLIFMIQMPVLMIEANEGAECMKQDGTQSTACPS